MSFAAVYLTAAPPWLILCAECTRSLATCDILSNCLSSHEGGTGPSPALPPATRLLDTVTHHFTFHKGGKIAAFLPMPSRARYVVAIAIVCLPGCLSSPPPPRRRRIPEQSRARFTCPLRPSLPRSLTLPVQSGQSQFRGEDDLSFSLAPSLPHSFLLRSKLIALSSKFDTVNGRLAAKCIRKGGWKERRKERRKEGESGERWRTITHSAPADPRCVEGGKWRSSTSERPI